MAAQENEEVSHLRPACVECTHRCNQLHGGQDLEEEKFDPDRSWPHFGRKVTKLALHHSPQAALCIPGAFTQEFPTSVQKGKPITLEGPSGNQWTVGATERSVFYPGWRAFAHDHRLHEGDQLHFRLTSPSHFVVDIFNSHGEVRRSARKAMVTGRYAAPTTPPRQPQSRKRKADMAEVAAIGKAARSSVVDRWNTPARNGNSFNESTPKLRFSEVTKQWESHESHEVKVARAAREEQMVTIDLDSDKEEPLVARSSKLERLIELMKEEEEEKLTTQKSKAFAARVSGDQKVIGAKSHQEIPNDGEVAYVAEGNEYFNENEKQRPSDDPFRHFTTIFHTTPKESPEDLQEMKEVTIGKAVFKAEKEKKLDSASNSLSQEAQPLRDEDVGMMKREEVEDEIYLAHSFKHLELDKITPQACVIEETKLEISVAERDTTPKGEEHEDLEAGKATKTTLLSSIEQQLGISDNRIDAQMLHSYKIPMAHEAAAIDYESVTHKASQVTIPTCTSVTAMSEMHENTENNMAEDGNGRPPHMQGAGGGFIFGSALNTVVEYPVIMNTVNEDLTDNVHPLNQGLKQTDDHRTQKPMEDEELDLCKSKNPSCIFEAHDLQEIKTEPGMVREENPNMPVQREGKIEKAIVLPSNYLNPEFTTPARDQYSNIQAKVAPTTNTCVLGSKRGPVFQADREKALNAAQAWAKRILNPKFLAVMKSSYVYTDFKLDIPAEFAKQAKLPETELRVTLVCDEVPTNCKAIWVGSKAQIDFKGWMNFSRSHCLEEGDVCVFECFTTMTSFRLGVYIFRVVKLKRPILHDWTRHYKVLECTDAAAGSQTRCTTIQAHDANSEEKVP